jgi:hypothetical protein
MSLWIALALVSCAEPTGPAAVPYAVLWVEWPAGVTAAQPGAVLVTYVDDFCATLSLNVSADFPLVTVRSEATPHANCTPPPLGPPFFPHDTLLVLPTLAAPYGLPAYYSIQGTLDDPGFGTASVRDMGSIHLAAVGDTTRYMAGTGTMLVDSAGCTVLMPGFGFARTYAVLNPPALGGQVRRALVGAHVAAVAPPAGCGTHRVVQLDYAIVTLVP